MAGQSSEDPAVATDAPVVLAVHEVPPFAMEEDGAWEGYSIDLWEEVADEVGLDFEYVGVPSVEAQLDSVQRGEADAALGAVSVTSEREQRFDFTQPMYDSSIGILVSDDSGERGLAEIVGSMLRKAVLWLLGIFGVLVVVVGHAVWFVERRRNPDHFPESYPQGVAEGMWWAVVTMTTVGYGDTVARTRAGRLVAVVWMLLGLVLVAQFTAVVTSSLTVEKIDGSITSIGDLYGRDVVTVEGTTSSRYLESIDLPATVVADVDLAVSELVEDRAEAVVYDEPVLAWEARTTANGTAHMVARTYEPQSIAMAWSEEDPRIEAVDAAILGLREDGTLAVLAETWFGT